MNFSSSTLLVISAALTSAAMGFVPTSILPSVSVAASSGSSLSGTATPVERESFQRSLLSARIANDAAKAAAANNGKKAENAPPVTIGWDSHTAVVSRLLL
mmetsp:Transcript_6984/g.14212  ORF Transcript_6984/g.14212 Transcript_6984/m.14212 type:complete len:101 (-) Transcript_6984:1563-1865(-)